MGRYRPRVPLPFAVDPTRQVEDPDGSTWTVAVVRGWAWPGWRWLDWLEARTGPTGSEYDFVLVAPALLAVPSVLARRLLYVLRRRHDWKVALYAGTQGDYRPRKATLVETAPDRAAANLRAEELSRAVVSGAWRQSE